MQTPNFQIIKLFHFQIIPYRKHTAQNTPHLNVFSEGFQQKFYVCL